ncbi:MAG: TVP38/TMEM64 family protein, partial [Chromatiales bacterium]|nr:TVP38/TMEM64 family protein [Chromatiales bacterium]
MNRTKLAVAAVAVIAIGSVIIFDLTQYLSFAAIENTHLWLADVYLTHPLAVAVGYFLGYVAVAALSIPGAAVMTLLGGAVFGVISGTVLVSFASTLGATLAFLFARFLLRDSVERRFSSYMTIVNRGVDREGGLYLFAMRLVPAIPFVVVNLVAALTQIRTLTFIWVSQLGMLPATIVYVNAGKELGALESASDVLSPAFILSFVALGILPLASSRIIRLVRTRKVQRDFQRPKQFDRNLVVIGAGAAGLVSA